MNKNLKFYTFILLTLGLFLFNACTDDTEDPVITDPDPVVVDATYTADAAPILNSSCAFTGCHVSGASIGSLANFADAKAFAGFGKLLKVINHEDGVQPMPRNSDKLSDANITSIEKWVADGLLE
ncbi:MAG: hypothetical protein COA58_15030 [Bacteroidetes bacterium]|nr:MAG: hypothetical protein COA58_15030 [Bacteroidota bacterium]